MGILGGVWECEEGDETRRVGGAGGSVGMHAGERVCATISVVGLGARMTRGEASGGGVMGGV